MTYTVLQKRSSTPNKRPLPAELLDGQLGVNFDTATAGLFFKNDTGGILKVGPTAIGTSAPAPSELGTVQLGYGETWLDTTDPSNNVLKVWNGVTWLPVGDGSTPAPGPTPPKAGLWTLIDTVIQPDVTDANIYTKGGLRLGGTLFDDAPLQVDSFGNLTTTGDITTSDLTLSNAHRSEGNEVDGTTGHWCFQEGESDLFLINRISGKKYAIELREVS